MNTWWKFTSWFRGADNLVAILIAIALMTIPAFVVWLIARHSWKCHWQDRVQERIRNELFLRDAENKLLKGELAEVKEQLQTVTTNQRAALIMLHKGIELISVPLVQKVIEIREAHSYGKRK